MPVMDLEKRRVDRKPKQKLDLDCGADTIRDYDENGSARTQCELIFSIHSVPDESIA